MSGAEFVGDAQALAKIFPFEVLRPIRRSPRREVSPTETDELIGREQFEDLDARKPREVVVRIGAPTDVILYLDLDIRPIGGLDTAEIEVGMVADSAAEIARVLQGPAQAAAPRPGSWFEIGRRPYRWADPYGGSGQVIVEASALGVRLRVTTLYEGNDFIVTMPRSTAARIGDLLQVAAHQLAGA